MDDNTFLKIIAREIPAEIVYEDEYCIAINDIYPKAKVHVLLIPKKKVATLNDFDRDKDPEVMHTFAMIPVVAKKLGLDHYQIKVNCGEEAGQEIFHIHIHILSGIRS